MNRSIEISVYTLFMSTLPDSRRPCITFTTDFGTRDTYVGQMKGVALGINPDLHLIDLSHEIPAQQILRGAYVWSDGVRAFPAETVHVGVVDPGVGSERRLIAAEIGNQRFVCPDNGLLSVILEREPLRRAVVLDQPKWWRASVSNTFHGRDILTPIAAAWSLGHDLGDFGSPVTSPLVTLSLPRKVKGGNSLTGQVVDIDHFGNLMTNIEASDLPAEFDTFRVEIGSFPITGLARCYADGEPGEPIALIGSAGRLEIAVREGRAADEFQAAQGLRVTARWTKMTP